MTKRILVIDDQRIFSPREDCEITHKTTSQEGWRTLLLDGPWDEIWLDHDLGMESDESGYSIALSLEKYVRDYAQGGVKPEEVTTDLLNDGGRIYVHSMNPTGAGRMVAAITRYFPVARIDPTPYLDFEAMYAQDRNPYLAGPRR